jgi:heme-degrading monooxygenase HmoA
MLYNNSSFHDAKNTTFIEDVTKNKVVFLNVFTIPEGKKAEELIIILEKATQEVMRYLQGFYSATIHVSLDGSRVMNYVIWDSAEDFKNMRKNPDVMKHMAEIKETFPPDGRLYKAISTLSAGDRAEK